MGVIDRKSRLFEGIVRLRRAEREHPSSKDIVTVRSDLERELGGVVSRSLAATLLGVSHTALQRWIAAGDLPTVLDERGHVRVPVGALAELYERVQQQRDAGTRRRHVLEPVLSEGRRQAETLEPRRLVHVDDALDRHERAALRSLAYHRAVARRLRRPMVDDARHQIWRWRSEGRIDPRYAQAWEDVLSRPISDIRKALIDDSPEAADLRQNSPFAGVLTEAERRKILREIR